MHLNTLAIWSLSDYCRAMDLAEQFRITWPSQIALATLGRAGSCKMLFIRTCIWPGACFYLNWVRTPDYHVRISGRKLKMCVVIQRQAQGTSDWEPQLRNQMLCFCLCNAPWSCDCTGLCSPFLTILILPKDLGLFVRFDFVTLKKS